MPIRQYLEGHRFDAETVRLMGVAFAMAVVTLQQRRRIDPLRDSVAHKIIELVAPQLQRSADIRLLRFLWLWHAGPLPVMRFKRFKAINSR